MQRKKFPQSKAYELSLLSKAPDFQELMEYIGIYIKQVLDRYEMPPETYKRLEDQLLGDVPIAARRYLQNKRAKRDYKFSTYFSWYVSEHLNSAYDIIRKNRKGG